MINLENNSHCVCKQFNNDQRTCVNAYTIREQGKTVKLTPSVGEQVMAIVLDGCVIHDNRPRADALFLYKSGTRKYSFLVEIKGGADIVRAFEQLRYTRDDRLEYQKILALFRQMENGKIVERFVIVSNAQLSRVESEKLENAHNIRVRKILHCEATTPVPDLRELL